MKKSANTDLNDSAGYSEKYISFMNAVFDLLVLGILWIICSIPLVTIGAASSALYYAVVKCIKKGESYPIRSFFHSFKMNLKQGSILTLIMLIISGTAVSNITILLNRANGNLALFMLMFYIAVLLGVITITIYLFAALSRYEMGSVWLLKQSAYMAVRHLGTTVMIWCMLFCIGVLLYKFVFLLILIPGPAVFVLSEFMENVLQRYEPEMEDRAE